MPGVLDVDETEKLLEISSTLNSSRDLQGVLDTTLAAMLELTGGDIASLMLYDHAERMLVTSVARGLSPATVARSRFAPGEGVAGEVFATGEPLLIRDAAKDVRFVPLPGGEPIHSMICVPLQSAGRTIGVLNIDSSEPAHHFSERHLALISVLGNHSAAAIENARLFADLEQQVHRSEEKSRELEGFVFSISHDLKGPLASIQGLLTQLARAHEAALGRNGLEVVNKLERKVSYIEKLLLDLLELSRIGRVPAEPRELETGEELERMAASYRRLFSPETLKLELLGPFPRIKFSAPQFDQIFENLIANALKYNDKEFRRVEIGCAAHQGGRWVRLDGQPVRGEAGLGLAELELPAPVTPDGHLIFYVEDNGAGLERDVWESVFQSFFRVRQRPTSSSSGTGLGLAIVKKIAREAFGEAWVFSEPTRGSAFYVALPRRLLVR